MPNWCHNSMTITGSVEEVARFKQMCNAGELARWGVPADDFHEFRVYGDEPGRYEFDFDTAWVSPVSAWNKLGEMFPALDFSVEGREPLMDFAIRGTIKDGGLFLYEMMDQPGIWRGRDANRTYCGTLEEIARAAGDDGPIWRAAPVWDDARVLARATKKSAALATPTARLRAAAKVRAAIAKAERDGEFTVT